MKINVLVIIQSNRYFYDYSNVMCCSMASKRVISRRKFLQSTGGVAASVAIAGCSGGNQEPNDDGSGDTTETKPEKQSDKVYRLVTSGVRTLDPIQATDIPAGTVIHNLFDALTNYPNAETTVQTLLAKDFEKKNEKHYVFKLKQGITFTNGKEVTANDFVYAWKRLAASKHSNRKSFLFDFLGVEHKTDKKGNYVPDSLGVKATDDYTFEVKLKKPFHAVLEMIAYNTFAAVPEGIVGDIKGYDGKMSQAEFAKNPVGAGPYKLEEWKKGTELKIKARPMDEYHGEGPYTAGTHWKVLSETNAIYTYSTRNLNADVPSVPASKYDESKITIEGTDEKGRKYGTYGPLENGITVDYVNMPILATYYVGFNCNNVEKPARQAWAYAYNALELHNQISGGPFQAAAFFSPPVLFPGGPKKYKEMKTEYPYGLNETKLDKAKQVMEKAGYSANNKYKFKYAIGDYQSYKEEARIMRDRLASAHIDLKIQTDKLSTRFDKIANGNIDAYALSWWADYPAADNFLQMLYPPNTQIDNPDSKNGFNWGGTKASKRAKKAWKKVQNNTKTTEQGQKARNEAYLEIEKARWEDLPVLTTNHYVTENMKYPWVHKPRTGAMGGAYQKHNPIWIGDRKKTA